jgi:hypothetical protein
MPNQSPVHVYLWFGGLFALALLIGPVLILLKRKNAAFLTFVIAASVISQFVALEIPSSPALQPLSVSMIFIFIVSYVLSVVAPTLLAIFLAFRIVGSYVTHDGPPEPVDSATLRTAVSAILDSEMFLTTLRSTLPQGKDDTEYGLDYVPYMLHSIDDRRKRAELSSRLFLLATGAAAVIFSTVVMYFGYILVNEAAAGSAKSLADLSRAMQQVSEMTLPLVPNYYRTTQFQKDVVLALEKPATMDPGPKNKYVQDRLHAALDAFQNAKTPADLSTLLGDLESLSFKVSKDGLAEQAYAAALLQAREKLGEAISSQNMALLRLETNVQELRVLIPKAEDVLSKPEIRTPEIIKRLALGVVISTFFLALLRFLANLYKTRYLQVLEAERDDFAVRRFYVVFKSSQASDEQRKAVLASFMTLASADGSQPKEPADESTKQEFEVIKELVQALSKKL